MPCETHFLFGFLLVVLPSHIATAEKGRTCQKPTSELEGMSGLTGIQDERDLYLKLFLAVVIYVSPFLLLFHVGDLDGLIRMLAAVVRRVYVLGMVVTLKRQNE